MRVCDKGLRIEGQPGPDPGGDEGFRQALCHQVMLQFHHGLNPTGQVHVAKDTGTIDEYIVADVRTIPCLGTRFVHEQVDRGGQVRVAKGIREVRVYLYNRIVLEDRGRSGLQVDRMIDIPENIPRGNDQGVRSRIPGGYGTRVALIGILIILVHMHEQVAGNIYIPPEIQRVIPHPGEDVIQDLQDRARTATTVHINHIVVPLVRAKAVALDNEKPIRRESPLACDMLADVVEAQGFRVFPRSKHIRENRLQDLNRGTVGIHHAQVCPGETHLVQHELRAMNAHAPVLVLGMMNIGMAHQVGT